MLIDYIALLGPTFSLPMTSHSPFDQRQLLIETFLEPFYPAMAIDNLYTDISSLVRTFHIIPQVRVGEVDVLVRLAKPSYSMTKYVL